MVSSSRDTTRTLRRLGSSTYHQACDTFANNNDVALDTMADAAAHATHTFGRTEYPIVDGGLIEEGKPTPDGDNDGDGTDSGGGLHPEHDHEDVIAE